MPYGDWINDLPTGFFLVVHIAGFAIALDGTRGRQPTAGDEHVEVIHLVSSHAARASERRSRSSSLAHVEWVSPRPPVLPAAGVESAASPRLSAR